MREFRHLPLQLDLVELRRVQLFALLLNGLAGLLEVALEGGVRALRRRHKKLSHYGSIPDLRLQLPVLLPLHVVLQLPNPLFQIHQRLGMVGFQLGPASLVTQQLLLPRRQLPGLVTYHILKYNDGVVSRGGQLRHLLLVGLLHRLQPLPVDHRCRPRIHRGRFRRRRRRGLPVLVPLGQGGVRRPLLLPLLQRLLPGGLHLLPPLGVALVEIQFQPGPLGLDRVQLPVFAVDGIL
mmetsp:Transcript_60693/g.140162  ORF Transcript_60693/g.140162 Transcript_60693/m.140162 type:complete len:236 (-) Transcript_60693:865-1572(-)